MRSSSGVFSMPSVLITGATFLIAGGLGDPDLVEVGLHAVVDILIPQQQGVRGAGELDVLVAGIDEVTSPLLVPLVECGRLVHFLDDVPPADARVVGAEGNFTFLSAVGNHALLGAAKIVGEQILEPHSGDEQEVPAILAALDDIFEGPVGCDFSVVPSGDSIGLVELLEERLQREVRRRLGTGRSSSSPRGPCPEPERNRPRAASLTLVTSLASWSPFKKGGDRSRFLGLLVDHDGHSRAAVGVATAAELTPVALGSVHQVGPVGERTQEGDGEPVASRLTESGHCSFTSCARCDERVALRRTALVAHRFVAAGEGDRLERKERNPLRVVEGEPNQTRPPARC